jgi:hypothetical protein
MRQLIITINYYLVILKEKKNHKMKVRKKKLKVFDLHFFSFVPLNSFTKDLL